MISISLVLFYGSVFLICFLPSVLANNYFTPSNDDLELFKVFSQMERDHDIVGEDSPSYDQKLATIFAAKYAGSIKRQLSSEEKDILNVQVSFSF